MRVRSSEPDDAYAGAIAMMTSDNTATATIGNEGWITVGGDLAVTALAERGVKFVPEVLVTGNSGSIDGLAGVLTRLF